jgi:hypothetical protein
MRVASRRLRLLAGLVDAAVVISGMALVGGVAVAGFVAYGRVRRRKDETGNRNESDTDESCRADGRLRQSANLRLQRSPGVHGESGEFRLRRTQRAALWGTAAGTAVATRNLRGPGDRLVGVRRVDARTGGAVSIRSALIGELFEKGWQAATKPLLEAFFGLRAERQQVRIRALRPQLRMVEREHADDPKARQRAVREFYKANDLKPLAGCGWRLAGLVASRSVLALGTRGGRTVRDRITGTTVIVDRSGSSARARRTADATGS